MTWWGLSPNVIPRALARGICLILRSQCNSRFLAEFIPSEVEGLGMTGQAAVFQRKSRLLPEGDLLRGVASLGMTWWGLLLEAFTGFSQR